jgi:hypothetical protein
MAKNGISTLMIASGTTLTKNINPPHSNTEIVPPYSAIWSLNYSGALGATDSVSYKLYVTSFGIGSAFTLTSHSTGDFAVTAGNFLYDEYGTSIGIIKGNTTIDNYMAKAAAVCGSLSNTIITAATYKGTWNAFTNTPTLTDGVGTLGDAYDTAVTGTSGAFPAYSEQDWRIYDGSVWQRVAKTTTTQWTITPATGGLADKEARQVAKLDIAQAKRQGKVVARDGTITGSLDATKRYFRDANTYDLNLLPTKYVGNTSYNNQDQTGSVRSLTSAAITADPITVSGYVIPGSDIIVNVTWPSGLTPAFDIRYGGIEHVRGQTYSIPKSAIQTGGTGSLVVTVDQVGLEPGRPWTAQAGAFVFVADWLMITYEFSDGQDLDTRTQITSPAITSFNPSTSSLGWTSSSVGYGQANIQGSPTIMSWGGDNTGQGFESVLINMSAFQTAFPGQTMTVDCRAYWYGSVGVNPVTIAAVLWKGGTPTQTGYIWTNAGATGTLALNQILVPVTTYAPSSTEFGQHVGTVTYSPTTGSGSIAL